jgi:hypothetical protein
MSCKWFGTDLALKKTAPTSEAAIEWKKAAQPKFLTWDRNVYSEKYGFGGTLDAIAEIDGEVVLIDFQDEQGDRHRL